MNRTALIALVMLTSLGSLPVQARDTRIDAKDFSQKCSKPFSSRPNDAIDYAYCVGYLSGVVESVRAEAARASPMPKICLPDTVDVDHLAFQIHQQVTANPKIHDEPTVSVVTRFLEKTFPCP